MPVPVAAEGYWPRASVGFEPNQAAASMIQLPSSSLAWFLQISSQVEKGLEVSQLSQATEIFFERFPERLEVGIIACYWC